MKFNNYSRDVRVAPLCAAHRVGHGGRRRQLVLRDGNTCPLSTVFYSGNIQTTGKGCIRFGAMVMGLIALLCFIGRRETGTARSSSRRCLMQSVSTTASTTCGTVDRLDR